MTQRISRRTVLKGLGTAIALPWLEGMVPGLSWSAPTTQAATPRRLAFFYVPNGVNMAGWTPGEPGSLTQLPEILRPLESLRQEVSVLSGLTCDKARANGDGPGDHARAMSAFLTCSQPKKTNGADIRAGISADQVAALRIGSQTRFPSLELGLEGGRQAGNCDSGYSCAYSSNLSWRSESMPMVKEIDPRQLFERLFGSGTKDEAAANQARRQQYQKSILDFVLEDASTLKKKLGATDQRKVDEYLTSVRELERRLERVEKRQLSERPLPAATRPDGIPKEFEDHARLLLDLLVVAFQADLTRISTFVIANDGSNRSYRFLEVPEGHHDLSHHGGDKEKLGKIQKINTCHVRQFAYFLEKLRSIPEGNGTLLDHCMIAYGSGIGDGNRHNHDELPILLAGKGGGSLKPGRHIRYKKETPLANLWLALLDRMGVPTQRHGDSTGKLESLS